MAAKQRRAAQLGNAEIRRSLGRAARARPNFRFAAFHTACMVAGMRLLRLLPCCLVLSLAWLRAAPATAPALTAWDKVSVTPMKTSIYVGSVKLVTGTFERSGATLSTTYEAHVVPWFFWSEAGRIAITLTDADLAKLATGQTAEFTGEAMNEKQKPRKVTGRAQPADASSGKIKVRVMADGIELIFNGTYRFGAD